MNPVVMPRHDRGVSNAQTDWIPPCHQGCARGRANRGGVEPIKLGSLGGNAIERGCLDDLVAVKPYIRPTEVIRHHNNDVRLVTGKYGGRHQKNDSAEEKGPYSDHNPPSFFIIVLWHTASQRVSRRQ